MAVERNFSIPGKGSIAYDQKSVLVLRSMNIDGIMEGGGAYTNAQYIADHLDLYDTWDYQGTLVSQIHAIRPDLRVVIYRNARAVYTTTDPTTSQWLLRTATGNIIYDVGYPTSYFLIDVGNPAYQAYVANWIKSQIDQYGFDGVFADFGVDWGIGLSYSLSGQAVNPRTGQLYTELEWVDDTVALANRVKQTIGSKLYIGNGVYDGNTWASSILRPRLQRFFTEVNPPIDGFMSEGTFRMDEDEATWKNSLDLVTWTQDNFLPSRPNGVFIPFCGGATNDAQIKYLFCSCLLGIKDFSKNYLWMSGGICTDYTQNLFKTNVGTPVGDYYTINQTRVYARDFTKVKILVNPTSNTYTVQVNSQSITMPPKTGNILSL